jgi:hypothetical protein
MDCRTGKGLLADKPYCYTYGPFCSRQLQNHDTRVISMIQSVVKSSMLLSTPVPT